MRTNRMFLLYSIVAVLATLLTSPSLFGQRGGEPTLTIGSRAPALEIEHWVSNGNGAFRPVTEFEDGKVYVVEFWATWCGPCIMSMPHIARVQEQYSDKGVQVISISDEDLDTVKEFLDGEVASAGRDDDEDSTRTSSPRTYGELTSVYCLTTDPDRSVHTDYMEAAAQNGIPTCFIVGKTGLVEWIGHPMEMDEPLEKIVDGTWDTAAYAEEFKKAQAEQMRQMEQMMKQQAVIGGFARLMQAGDFDAAAEALEKIAGESDDPELLNSISWRLFEMADADDEFPKALVKAATVAAEKAVSLDPENGMILDTLAHLVYMNGDLDRALELQTKAMKNPGPDPAPIREFLERLQREKEGKDK